MESYERDKDKLRNWHWLKNSIYLDKGEVKEKGNATELG